MAAFAWPEDELIRAVADNDPDVQEIRKEQLRNATEEQFIRLCNALQRNTKVRTVDFSYLYRNARTTPEVVQAIADLFWMNSFIEKAAFERLTNDEIEPIADSLQANVWA